MEWNRRRASLAISRADGSGRPLFCVGAVANREAGVSGHAQALMIPMTLR